MIAKVCVRCAVAGLLLSALACAAAPRDPASLQLQRTAELDQLGAQEGMGYARTAPSALEARINTPVPPLD